MRVKVLAVIGAVVLAGFVFSEEPGTKGIEKFPHVVLDEINDRSPHDHLGQSKYDRFWQKFELNPKWVKEWQEQLSMDVWKYIWGPLEVKEWVPVSKSSSGCATTNCQSDWVKPEDKQKWVYYVKYPY